MRYVTLFAVVTAAGWLSAGHPQGTQAPTTTRPAIVALLADNRLIAVDNALRAVAGVRLGRPPSDPAVGRLMALAGDARTLFVLVRAGGVDRDRIAIFDTYDLSVRRTITLPGSTRYRALALDPQSGRLYVFGHRRTGRDRSEPWLTVADPVGSRPRSWRLRADEGRDWLPIGGAVSPDERYAVVSYHGQDTSGADVVDLGRQELSTCRRAGSSAPCLGSVHGHAAFVGATIVAATGDAERVLQLKRDGTVMRRWSTGLTGNHLMEFTVSNVGQALSLVGSCGYSGGLARIDVRRPRAEVLVAPVRPGTRPPVGHVCGERIEPVGKAEFVIASLDRPVPSAGPGRLLLVRGSDGDVLRDITTSAEPVDVVGVQ